MTDATACSVLSVHEPLAGSAPRARGWLILEHSGPYGRVATDALGDVAERLRDHCRDAGITVLLARRPRESGRRAWLAMGGHMVEWGDVDPAAFLHVDLEAVARGDVPVGAVATTRPRLFICTNGKRDACCAQFGRPLAEALMRGDEDVLECSHIGGHRMAPTALLLPVGSVHGRLTVESARLVLDSARAGHLHRPSLRGLSHLSAPEQVADIAVRDKAGIDTVQRLTVTSAGTVEEYDVTTPDDRRWRVTLGRREGSERPESCGKEPLTPTWWTVEHVEAV